MLSSAFQRLYDAATELNRRNILDLVSDREYVAMCDLGCDDGDWTMNVAARSRASEIHGLEIVSESAQIAATRGVRAQVANLESPFPFADESFDLVHANQVIEHIGNLDHFLAEIHRVLKVGGAAIISTENGSSWHNIFAAVMGWQIFSLTNVSALRQGIGNPLAIHRGARLDLPSWTHKTIFNYRGLLEILELHGMRVVQSRGAGYYPLPAVIGRVDPRRSHFITMKAIKTSVAGPR